MNAYSALCVWGSEIKTNCEIKTSINTKIINKYPNEVINLAAQTEKQKLEANHIFFDFMLSEIWVQNVALEWKGVFTIHTFWSTDDNRAEWLYSEWMWVGGFCFSSLSILLQPSHRTQIWAVLFHIIQYDNQHVSQHKLEESVMNQDDDDSFLRSVVYVWVEQKHCLQISYFHLPLVP